MAQVHLLSYCLKVAPENLFECQMQVLHLLGGYYKKALQADAVTCWASAAGVHIQVLSTTNPRQVVQTLGFQSFLLG